MVGLFILELNREAQIHTLSFLGAGGSLGLFKEPLVSAALDTARQWSYKCATLQLPWGIGDVEFQAIFDALEDKVSKSAHIQGAIVEASLLTSELVLSILIPEQDRPLIPALQKLFQTCRALHDRPEVQDCPRISANISVRPYIHLCRYCDKPRV